MKRRSDFLALGGDDQDNDAWEAMRERIIGLGERSLRKSYYPELRKRLDELQRFRILFDQGSDLVFLVELPSFKLRDVNQPACDALGRERTALLHRPAGDLLPSDLQAALTVLPDGASIHLETELAGSDGPLALEVTASIAGRGVADPLRRLALLVCRDIGERRAAEAAKRESERRFADFATASSDWFWECDAEGRMTFVSDAFESMSGVAPAELVGQPREAMLHRFARAESDEERDQLTTLIAAFRQRHRFRDLRLRWRRPSGGLRHVRLSGVPVFDHDGGFQGFRGSGRDVTQVVMAERRLHRAREARATAEAENRAKSTFLANMSHELRTPLNAIIGFSDALLSGALSIAPEGRTADYLADIRDSGQHLLELINDLLDLSKIAAGKMELCLDTVSVPDLLADVACKMRPLADQNGDRLEVEIEPAIGSLCADRLRLAQILFNLASNACKFTENGTVTLRAARLCTPQGSFIDVTVTDTGIGIAPQQLERLFQEYTQGDSSVAKSFGGTGLGLALSRRLARMMGGDITVRSQLGRGTTFTVRLPEHPVADPATCPGHADPLQCPVKSPRLGAVQGLKTADAVH